MKKIKKNIFGIGLGLGLAVILGIGSNFVPQSVIAEGGSSCTVSKECFTPTCGNSTISCTGTIKCIVKPTYVKCDNTITYCCGYGND